MNAGYILGDEKFLNELSLNQRNNVFWTIVRVRRGAGMYLLGGSLKCLNEGDLMIFPPAVSFSFSPADLGDEYNINLDVVVLRFDTDWLKAVMSAFPVASEMILKIREMRSPVTVTGPKWIRLSSLLDDLVDCRKNSQPLKIFSILELLSDRKDESVISDVNGTDPIMQESRREMIDRYLECNFSGKVTLAKVSDYVGMSRVYFSMFFKSLYGEGFADYLNRVRVEKSKQLLVATSKSLPAIASECGFKTVQYYNRIFRKVTGATPGTYRKEKSRLVHKDD